MKRLVFLLSILVLKCAAFAGTEGHGGDAQEIRFIDVAHSIAGWISSEKAQQLKLPVGITYEQYKIAMLTKLENFHINFTDKVVTVNGAEKTCKNWINAENENQIQCNTSRFIANQVDDIYRLVHHEFAGLAGFESGQGKDSNYEISDQIYAFIQAGNIEAPPPIEPANKEHGLILKIFSRLSNKNMTEVFKETGASVCQTTPTDPTISCTIEVPQERLYFSKLRLEFSWFSSSCKFLTFQPYYYQASASSHYFPSWLSEPVDCSSGNKPKCFGGVAPLLINNFPANRSVTYLTDGTDQVNVSEIDIPSAASLQYRTNRLTVNDLPYEKRVNNYDSPAMGAFGDSYVANSFVDYSFKCSDEYGNPIQSLRLSIKDASGGQDKIFTWKELP